MYLTSEEYEFIFENIKDIHCLDIEESNYSQKDVNQINRHSENSYMARLNFYKFNEDIFEFVNRRFKEIEEDSQIKNKDEEKSFLFETEIFYKGIFLTRCSKKDCKNEKRSQAN